LPGICWGWKKSDGGSALGALLLEHAFDEIRDFSRGGGAAPAAGRRSRNRPLAGRGDGKAIGEQWTKKFHQHERIEHAPLLGEKNLAEILVAEARRNMLGKRCFQAIRLGDLSAGATETDLPAEPGDAFIITRLDFRRQLEGRFGQVRRARPVNDALVRNFF
jgi:hypothetical protein